MTPKYLPLIEVLEVGIPIRAVPPCTLSHCFTNREFFEYRDRSIDERLSPTIPATAGGSAVVYNLTALLTCPLKLTRIVLGRQQNSKGHDGDQSVLYQHGMTFSPLQVQNVIISYESGDRSFPLLDNGRENMFYVHDAGGKVFILILYKVTLKRWAVTFKAGFYTPLLGKTNYHLYVRN